MEVAIDRRGGDRFPGPLFFVWLIQARSRFSREVAINAPSPERTDWDRLSDWAPRRTDGLAVPPVDVGSATPPPAWEAGYNPLARRDCRGGRSPRYSAASRSPCLAGA